MSEPNESKYANGSQDIANDRGPQPTESSKSDADATSHNSSSFSENEDANNASDEGSIEEQLKKAQADAEVLRDKWLRSLADFDNFRKRTKREIEEAVLRALQGVLEDILPVGDNLERALESAGDREDQLVTGIRMVRHVFLSALEKHGIKPMGKVGAVFDPNFHDALAQVDSAEYPPGVITLVHETGFTRHDKLLRPAKVVVSSAASTGTTSESEVSATDQAIGDSSGSQVQSELRPKDGRE